MARWIEIDKNAVRSVVHIRVMIYELNHTLHSFANYYNFHSKVATNSAKITMGYKFDLCQCNLSKLKNLSVTRTHEHRGFSVSTHSPSYYQRKLDKSPEQYKIIYYRIKKLKK